MTAPSRAGARHDAHGASETLLRDALAHANGASHLLRPARHHALHQPLIHLDSHARLVLDVTHRRAAFADDSTHLEFRAKLHRLLDGAGASAAAPRAGGIETLEDAVRVVSHGNVPVALLDDSAHRLHRRGDLFGGSRDETAAVLGADFDARARLVLKPVDGGASLADDAAGSEAGARHGLLHEIAAHLPAANLARGAAVGPWTGGTVALRHDDANRAHRATHRVRSAGDDHATLVAKHVDARARLVLDAVDGGAALADDAAGFFTGAGKGFLDRRGEGRGRMRMKMRRDASSRRKTPSSLLSRRAGVSVRGRGDARGSGGSRRG